MVAAVKITDAFQKRKRVDRRKRDDQRQDGRNARNYKAEGRERDQTRSGIAASQERAAAKGAIAAAVKAAARTQSTGPVAMTELPPQASTAAQHERLPDPD